MKSRVLVADDDPSTRALIDMALQEAGYDCVLAADGQSALEQARATRPDLVVLDVGMPFMTGDEVHRELRRDPRTRYIPVVFVTAKRTTAEVAARLRNGADDYIAKPFDIDELVARIASALRRAAELRSLNPLSGLPGNLSIAHEIDARLTDGSETACLYVDVDHFKDFNDHQGFARGDDLIAHLAELLSQTVGEIGDDTFIGHVGGDDFVVLVPDAARGRGGRRDHRALRRIDPGALQRGGSRARLGRGTRSPRAHAPRAVRHRLDRRRAASSGAFRGRDRGRARRGRDEGGREAPSWLRLRDRPPPRKR